MNLHNISEENSNRIVVISLFLSFACIFFLSSQEIRSFLYIKKVIFVSAPVFLGTFLLLNRKVDWTYIFSSIAILVYYFLAKRIDAIAEWILLSWAFFLTFLEPKIKLSKKIYFGFQVFSIVIVVLNFLFFDRYGRESIGGLDPNYSALLIYCLIPYFLLQRSNTGLFIILVLGLATQSRGFLLASIIVLFSLFIQRRKKIEIKLNTFLLVFLILFLVLLIYSFYGVSLGLESYEEYKTGWDRLLHVFNNVSDYYRWKANTIFFDFSLHDYNFLIFGSEPASYLKDRFIFLPHNLPLLELATHGLFGILYLLIFFKIIKKIYDPFYFPFFLGLLSFWLFLGVEIGSIYTVFIANLFVFLSRVDRLDGAFP